ncbi:MAG: nicotinate (nicotinamide) nucleotide adenylyltransferase [Pseudomonadota bacterium]
MLRLPAFSPGQRIGLFGGSFNPAHAGHLATASAALKRLQLDAVWWLVSPQNPLKSTDDTADFAKRMEDTKALVRHPRMTVSDVEQQLGSTCTAETLTGLAPVLDRGHFVWIMGADSFAELHRWYDWKNLPATLPLCIFDRPGHGLRALTSPAALTYAHARMDAADAPLLAGSRLPAWAFITWPLRPESSTALRNDPRGS